MYTGDVRYAQRSSFSYPNDQFRPPKHYGMQSNLDGRPPHVRSIAKDRSLRECSVMARTISSSISGPVNLVNPAQDKPLVITRKGAVISGPGVDGIDGTAAA